MYLVTSYLSQETKFVVTVIVLKRYILLHDYVLETSNTQGVVSNADVSMIVTFFYWTLILCWALYWEFYTYCLVSSCMGRWCHPILRDTERRARESPCDSISNSQPNARRKGTRVHVCPEMSNICSGQVARLRAHGEYRVSSMALALRSPQSGHN